MEFRATKEAAFLRETMSEPSLEECAGMGQGRGEVALKKKNIRAGIAEDRDPGLTSQELLFD